MAIRRENSSFVDGSETSASRRRDRPRAVKQRAVDVPREVTLLNVVAHRLEPSDLLLLVSGLDLGPDNCKPSVPQRIPVARVELPY